MLLARRQLVAPVLDVVRERNFLRQPVDALLRQPRIVGPRIVERLVDRLGVEEGHDEFNSICVSINARCHPERSEGSLIGRLEEGSLATLGMTQSPSSTS